MDLLHGHQNIATWAGDISADKQPAAWNHIKVPDDSIRQPADKIGPAQTPAHSGHEKTIRRSRHDKKTCCTSARRQR
jgi:hypothetical protein